MDPKVCGKLLTLHLRGNGVDVEALRDRFRLRQIAGKSPKMGSRVQKVAAVELGFRGYFWWFGNICEYIGGRSR